MAMVDVDRLLENGDRDRKRGRQGIHAGAMAGDGFTQDRNLKHATENSRLSSSFRCLLRQPDCCDAYPLRRPFLRTPVLAVRRVDKRISESEEKKCADKTGSW